MTEVERMRIIPNPMIEKNISEIDKTEYLQQGATMTNDMHHATVGTTLRKYSTCPCYRRHVDPTFTEDNDQWENSFTMNHNKLIVYTYVL